MKFLFILITLVMLIPSLLYRKPVIVVAEEGKVSPAVLREHGAALPSPVATDEAKQIPTVTVYKQDAHPDVQATIEAIAREKGWSAHIESWKNLAWRESGFNAHAHNGSSGACGIPQAVPCSKMPCEMGDVTCQVKWMADYIERRYGNPSKAYAFWLARNPINGVDVGHWY